jgi:hypothetical protein
MSSYQPEQHLRETWNTLTEAWQSSAEVWQDSVRDEFSNNYWQEFEQCVAGFSTSLESMIEVLNQARQSVAGQ